MKKLITAAAGAAMLGGLLLAPNAVADDEIVVPGVGSVDTDGASYLDADGEKDGALTQLDERLDGWAGLSEDGVCASSHGSRNEPDPEDEDYQAAEAAGESTEASCNEALLEALAEG